MNKKCDLLRKVYKMALFRQCRFVIYKSRKDGRGDKKMKRNDYRIERRHINAIKPGDTVVRYGEMLKVTSRDIENDMFIGRTIFGDNYNHGYSLVTVAVFNGEDI